MSSKADNLTQPVKDALETILREHLREHPIWRGKFFTAIEHEPDISKRWALLVKWIEQMPHASFGFTTYVSHLAARTQDVNVRELLVQNLHEEHTSPANHFRMICGLKGKVTGKSNTLQHDFPELLPTSRQHVTTHTNLARDGDFLEGIGTLLLIENLTAEEFRRVREACRNTWQGSPANFFDEGGGGTGYFKANEDADEGHAVDMMLAVQAAIQAEGADINDPIAIKPFMERITRGVLISINCRTEFVEGIYG